MFWKAVLATLWHSGMRCSASRSSIADTIKWCPATRFWAVGRSLLEGLCSYTPEVSDLGLKNFSPCHCQEVKLIWFASKIGLAIYKIRTKLKSSSRRPLPFTEMWWAGAFLRCGNVARKLKKYPPQKKWRIPLLNMIVWSLFLFYHGYTGESIETDSNDPSWLQKKPRIRWIFLTESLFLHENRKQNVTCTE